MTTVIRSYSCRECRTEAVTRDAEMIPRCGCGTLMSFVRARWTQAEYLGFSTGMKAPAMDFNQTKGRVAPIDDGIEVNSLRDIRRIERESEKMARDGVIASPYVFRKYSQDNSNLHTHTMGPSPQQSPSKEWMAKQGHKPWSPISEEDAESTEMGPGAREELASYLPDEPV